MNTQITSAIQAERGLGRTASITRRSAVDTITWRAVKRIRTQSGVTLLEALASLVILGAVMAGAASLVDNYTTSMRTSDVSQHANMFAQAMQAFIKDNYDTISNNPAVGPQVITVNMLTVNGTSDRYLPRGFRNTNGYGQTICGLVVRSSVATATGVVENQLNGLVVTEGGTQIRDPELGQIANVITAGGFAGGGIFSNEPGNVRGAGEGWRVPVGAFGGSGSNCNGAAGPVALVFGHPAIALWYSFKDETSAFLHRDSIPGRGQLNQMNADISMGGGGTRHDLNDVRNVNAMSVNTGTLTATGDATVDGMLRTTTIDMRGNNLNNANTVNAVTVNASANVNAGANVYATTGEVRAGTTVTAGTNVHAGNNVYAGQDLVADRTIYAGYDIAVQNRSWLYGDVTSHGNMYMSGFKLGSIPGTTRVGGQPCAPSGWFAVGDDGVLLGCEGGVWRAPNRISTLYFKQSDAVHIGEVTAYCNGNDVALSGGGSSSHDGTPYAMACGDDGDGGHGYMHYSRPHLGADGVPNGWTVNSYSPDKGDVCSRAYVVCMARF